MDCKGCSIASVCVLYEFVRDKSQYADINISNCRIKPSTKDVFDTTNQKHTPNPNSWVGERPVRDFTQVSNENKKAQETEKKVIQKAPLKVVPMESKAEIITCPTCGGETADDDLSVCSDCGKTVCPNCGTEDPETHSLKCEKCW